MIKIDVIASGSKGNCYTICDGTTTLLLEAGIKAKPLGRALARCKNIAGALITHEHKDHALSVEYLAKWGINIYASQGTFNALNVHEYAQNILRAGDVYDIGEWIVLPFEVAHDTEEPLGFYIRSQRTAETVLFATDTRCIYNRFRRIDYLMIECNYIDELLRENEANGKINYKLAERIRDTHFSLDDVKDFCIVNSEALKRCKEIYLIHLSARNCNAEVAEREVERLTGIPSIAFPKRKEPTR